MLSCSGIYAKQGERVISITAGCHLCEIPPYLQQTASTNLHHIHLLTNAH